MGFLGDVDQFFFEEGADIGDFLPHVIHHASNFACSLYKQNPGVIYDLNYFNKGLWEKLCRRRPPGLPPAPSPDFDGGQCDFYYILSRQSSNGTIVDATGNPIKGPIKGIELDWVKHPRFGTWGWKFLITSPQVLNSELYDGVRYMINASATYNDSAVRPDLKPTFLRVYPRDGQPDVCGDPVPDPVPPVVLPDPARTTNITYTFDDGITVTFPITLAFPVVFNTFRFAPSLTIQPQLNLNPEINIHLLPDGWHSDPQDQNQDEEKDSGDKIEYYFYPPNPDDDPLVRPSPPTPVDNSAADEDIPGARWLRVVLTTFPDKAQYGNKTPNVYFAGWVEFVKGGDCLPRQQVNFQRSLFRFPDGADGYYVQFTNGAKGYTVVYTEVQEDA